MQSVRQEMQSVREEMLQATREATLDATRQLDEVTAAARDAAAQIEQATETAADKIDSAADVAVEEASAEIEQIAHEAAAEAAQEVTHDLASELGERTGVGPATSAPDAPHIPTPLSSAGDINGQPVARTSRPGAPQPQNENAPGQGVWIDAETHAAARAEVETLKQQLTSVNDELRDLRTLVQALRDELHPAASSGQQ
jgi:hypothetical protein